MGKMTRIKTIEDRLESARQWADDIETKLYHVRDWLNGANAAQAIGELELIKDAADAAIDDLRG